MVTLYFLESEFWRIDHLKEESENVGIKLNIPKTKIMAFGPISPWQIEKQ